MSGKSILFILIAIIIAVISIKLLFGAIGLLFTKVGLAVLVIAAIYIWIKNKQDPSSEE